MAEFIRTEEKAVNVGEPIIFENNTDSDFSVSAAIVFRKSGLYDVSVVGKRTIVSKVAGRKTGEWINLEVAPFANNDGQLIYERVCNQCYTIAYFRGIGNSYIGDDFCPGCGARMIQEGEENDEG